MDNFRSGFDSRAILRSGFAGRLSSRALLIGPFSYCHCWFWGEGGSRCPELSTLPSAELAPSFTIADFDRDSPLPPVSNKTISWRRHTFNRSDVFRICKSVRCFAPREEIRLQKNLDAARRVTEE